MNIKDNISDLTFMQEVTMLRCQVCEQVKDDVRKTNCPFQEEIYGKIVRIVVCQACYDDRLYDI